VAGRKPGKPMNNDNQSGSVIIGQKSIDDLTEIVKNIDITDRSTFFVELTKQADKISKKVWYMGTVYSQLKAVIKQGRLQTRAEKDIEIIRGQILSEITEMRLRLKSNLAKLAENAAKLLFSEREIFTFSQSESIYMALQYLARIKQHDPVINILESHPGEEGILFANRIADLGYKVHLYPDLNAGAVIRQSDIILVGADRLLNNEFFNKSGTSIILNLAHAFHKQTVIVSDLSKLVPLSEFMVGRFDPETDETFVAESEKIAKKFYRFERISYDYVSRFSTEIGNFEFEDFRSRYLV
jgi:translation initiation factor 2B subunit (eIF-2B alpha/beta/delta family)